MKARLASILCGSVSAGSFSKTSPVLQAGRTQSVEPTMLTLNNASQGFSSDLNTNHVNFWKVHVLFKTMKAEDILPLSFLFTLSVFG